MPTLSKTLDLLRCPHCSVHKPNIQVNNFVETNNSTGTERRLWGIYICNTCGGVITTFTYGKAGDGVSAFFPYSESVEDEIPTPAKEYLQQSIESIHAPAGSVMLAASAVDAMLKLKGYKEGSLYQRIEQAAQNHLITGDMATWAHEVRLDANAQRHADEAFTFPSRADAQKVIDFTTALGEILFVLPAKVQKGLQQKSNS